MEGRNDHSRRRDRLGGHRRAPRALSRPPAHTLDGALAALAAGQLVILPTETVYGLAADAGDPLAVARLFEAKGRPRFNPLIAHVADLASARPLARLDARASSSYRWSSKMVSY